MWNDKGSNDKRDDHLVNNKLLNLSQKDRL